MPSCQQKIWVIAVCLWTLLKFELRKTTKKNVYWTFLTVRRCHFHQLTSDSNSESVVLHWWKEVCGSVFGTPLFSLFGVNWTCHVMWHPLVGQISGVQGLGLHSCEPCMDPEYCPIMWCHIMKNLIISILSYYCVRSASTPNAIFTIFGHIWLYCH